MKKIVFASAALISTLGTANVFAATNICTGATTAGDGSSVSTGGFVKQAFTPKCSANVFAGGVDGTSIYAVGAASQKGKNIFAGSTNGGGVAPVTPACGTPGACTQSEANSAADTASGSS